MILESFLGKIRVPKSIKIECKALPDEQCYELSYEAQNADGKIVRNSKRYQGLYLAATSLTDLVQWMQYTSNTFFGGR